MESFLVKSADGRIVQTITAITAGHAASNFAAKTGWRGIIVVIDWQGRPTAYEPEHADHFAA